MAALAQPDVRPVPVTGVRGVRKAYLTLVGLLSSTILLKVMSIQYLELLFLAHIVAAVGIVVYDGRPRRILRVGRTMTLLYLVIIAIAIVLSVVALRNPIYYEGTLSLLNRPVWITVSRGAELAIDCGAMVLLTQWFYRDREALLYTGKVYYIGGLLSALYSLVTYPLNYFLSIDLGTYADLHRMRGFYNEGGPYGAYVLTLFVVGIMLRRNGKLSRGAMWASMIPILICQFGSQSKAAVFGGLAMLLVNVLYSQSAKQRVLVLGLLGVSGGLAVVFVDLPGQYRAYQVASAQYERISHLKAKDYNFVLGRVAGQFIVPRMIAAHPYLGIGWGNYGLVRNDVEYRGASAWVNENDSPGLGVFGLAAEFGLPLITLLVITLMVPFFYIRRLPVPVYVINLALLQPIVHIIAGQQLNVTYPWVTTAFALGLAFASVKPSATAQRVGTHALAGAS